MSSTRISVEWGIGRVKGLWRALMNRVCKLFLTWTTTSQQDSMRVLAQRVSIQVIVAIFLTNLHGILNGNLTQHYFSVEPPTLSEYLWETGTEVQTFSSSLRKLSESSWGGGEVYKIGGLWPPDAYPPQFCLQPNTIQYPQIHISWFFFNNSPSRKKSKKKISKSHPHIWP